MKRLSKIIFGVVIVLCMALATALVVVPHVMTSHRTTFTGYVIDATDDYVYIRNVGVTHIFSVRSEWYLTNRVDAYSGEIQSDKVYMLDLVGYRIPFLNIYPTVINAKQRG